MRSNDQSTITLTPSWTFAVQAFIVTLTNGTDEGKAMAEEELLAMGEKLDRAKKLIDSSAERIAELDKLLVAQTDREIEVVNDLVIKLEMTRKQNKRLREDKQAWQAKVQELRGGTAL